MRISFTSAQRAARLTRRSSGAGPYRLRAMQLGLIAAAFAVSASAQSFLAELKLEHDPGRRAELALSFADESFDSAKTNYH
jgi:hypothetical protein